MAIDFLEFLLSQGARGAVLEKTWGSRDVSDRVLSFVPSHLTSQLVRTFVPLLQLLFIEVGRLLQLIELGGGKL